MPANTARSYRQRIASGRFNSPRWRRMTWSATRVVSGMACYGRARRCSSVAPTPSDRIGRRAASATAPVYSPYPPASSSRRMSRSVSFSSSDSSLGRPRSILPRNQFGSRNFATRRVPFARSLLVTSTRPLARLLAHSLDDAERR